MKTMKKGFLFAVVVLMSFLSANAFEGEIKYRTYTNYSSDILKLQPLLFNGENYCTMIVKGDKMMLNDYRKGTITIWTPETMTEYCPADNTGYSCPALPVNPIFTAKETTQTREMLGTTVTKYVCDENANIGIEFYGWIAKSGLGLSQMACNVFNGGLNVPGVAVKSIFQVQSLYSTLVCREILSITPRDVDDCEFDIIPADAQIDISKDGSIDLYLNFFKAHPVKPQKIDKESYELDEDWDF